MQEQKSEREKEREEEREKAHTFHAYAGMLIAHG
jgi:hypothetical protein